jgi:Protein of unknown function (DUF2948)
MAGLLKLRARDAGDLETIAACVQDALVAQADIKYLPRERRFALMLNRFRWEAAPAAAGEPAPKPAENGDAEFAGGEAEFERIHAVLVFDRVRAVKRKGLDKAATDGVLSLLTLRLDGRYLIIAFAGGGAIRLDIDQLVCQLEDVGESWPTVWRPGHSESEAGGGSSGGGRP